MGSTASSMFVSNGDHTESGNGGRDYKREKDENDEKKWEKKQVGMTKEEKGVFVGPFDDVLQFYNSLDLSGCYDHLNDGEKNKLCKLHQNCSKNQFGPEISKLWLMVFELTYQLSNNRKVQSCMWIYRTLLDVGEILQNTTGPFPHPLVLLEQLTQYSFVSVTREFAYPSSFGVPYLANNPISLCRMCRTCKRFEATAGFDTWEKCCKLGDSF